MLLILLMKAILNWIGNGIFYIIISPWLLYETIHLYFWRKNLKVGDECDYCYTFYIIEKIEGNHLYISNRRETHYVERKDITPYK